MQGKAAVCVLLLTLVSCKTLGTGTRDKKERLSLGEADILLLIVFSVRWFLFFLSFFPSNLISCQELKQK